MGQSEAVLPFLPSSALLYHGQTAPASLLSTPSGSLIYPVLTASIRELHVHTSEQFSEVGGPFPHFPDVETEAQRGAVTCLKTHSG